MSRYTTSITTKIRWTSLSGSTARISRCEGQKEVLKLVEWKHVFGRVGISLHLPLQFVMFSIIYIMLLLKTQEIPKLRQNFSFLVSLLADCLYPRKPLLNYTLTWSPLVRSDSSDSVSCIARSICRGAIARRLVCPPTNEANALALLLGKPVRLRVSPIFSISGRLVPLVGLRVFPYVTHLNRTVLLL